jgi:uncharacterized protein YukE
MNTQELIQKIDKLKGAFEGETDPELKEKFKNKIAALEKQVAEAEASVAKKEEVIVVKEEKKVDDAEERLKKFMAAAASEDDPELKAKFQKKIDELKSKMKEVKEEIKEEKQELKEVKQDVKEAVKEVKSAEKQVRKEAIKKVKEVKEVREDVVKRKKKRSKKLDDIMSDLDKAIAKSKKLTEKYTVDGKTKTVGGKKVDIERDAKRKAKPFGWRFKGDDDYRVPTLAQRRKNPDAVDYEARPNRADVKRKGKVLLEDGGGISTRSQEYLVFLVSKYDVFKKLLQAKNYEHGRNLLAGYPKLEEAYNTAIDYLKGKDVDATLDDVISDLEDKYDVVDNDTMAELNYEFRKGNNASEEFAKGGAVYSREKDAQRTAKPKGWRWKDEAIEKGLIPKTARYKNPSKYYRNKYPDFVYYEARQSKSDKKPSIRYKSL